MLEAFKKKKEVKEKPKGKSGSEESLLQHRKSDENMQKMHDYAKSLEDLNIHSSKEDLQKEQEKSSEEGSSKMVVTFDHLKDQSSSSSADTKKPGVPSDIQQQYDKSKIKHEKDIIGSGSTFGFSEFDKDLDSEYLAESSSSKTKYYSAAHENYAKKKRN